MRVVLLAGACLGGSSAHAQLEPGEPEDGFEQTTWASGMSGATDIAFLSDGRGVVTGKTGRIWFVKPDGSVVSAIDTPVDVDSESEKGLLGVVIDDADNLYFYASAGNSSTDKHRIFKGNVDASGAVSIDTSNNLIGSGLEGPANHDGGGMVIHDGQLYVGVGDTGFNASPPVNRYGTCLNKPNGKILRINLDGSIPSDNPLVGMSMVTGCASETEPFEMLAPDERIYAWGLRNPWRIYVDAQTGLLWIGDVGEVTQEEITVGGKGAHHGWPFHEGTVTHGALDGIADCQAVVPSTACTPPQHGYPRDDGISVTGGLIPPSGCGWGAFEQRYFFGDYGSGAVWTLDLTADRRGAVDGSRKDFTHVDNNVSFRMGPDGAMYVISHEPGEIIRIAPESVPATCSAIAPSGAAGAGGVPVPGAGGPAGNWMVVPTPQGSAGEGGDGCGCQLVGRRAAIGAQPLLGAALPVVARLVTRRRRSARVSSAP